jgi:hypothetical protein
LRARRRIHSNNFTLYSLERESQRLSTAALRAVDAAIDNFPIPGGAAVFRSLLDAVEVINVSSQPNLRRIRFHEVYRQSEEQL